RASKHMREAAISASSAGGPAEVDRVTPPLAGIRVLELGRVLAGPFCGMLLADLGAEVIKVEPPGGGDARTFGPFVDGSSTYDLLVQGMSGLMAATGPVGGGPTRSAVSLGDLVPGLYGALGALAALYERERTGVGRHVDVAMLDSLVSLLESVAMRALHSDDP